MQCDDERNRAEKTGRDELVLCVIVDFGVFIGLC